MSSEENKTAEQLAAMKLTEGTAENDSQAEAEKKKKKKKKKKNAKNDKEASDEEVDDLEDKEASAKEELVKALYGSRASHRNLIQDPLTKEHKFWSTQPVPQHGEELKTNEPIEVKTVDQVQAKPYALPKGFVWSPCDMNDPVQVDEVYTLLYENYVEDDDNMFRFDYSREFLQWALKYPGYHPDLHVCVRATSSNNMLVGFITGVWQNQAVRGTTVPMVEINFLCVHKKLRSKRLAPVLIKEITRRVNLKNVWQAVYTAGVVLPKPVARTRYFHRSLNPKKLIDIGFSRLAPRMTLQRTIKLYRLPDTPQVPGIRALEERDVPAAFALLRDYLLNFKLHPVFTEEEFRHCFLTRNDVVYSYVVENPETKQITDMCSFYCLPSTIIGHKVYNKLKAAYSFYNVRNK
jgi:glycylpeptide N-tetradecanoyltransferase